MWHYRNEPVICQFPFQCFGTIDDAAYYYRRSKYDIHRHIIDGVPVHDKHTLLYMSMWDYDVEEDNEEGVPGNSSRKRSREQGNEDTVRTKRVRVDGHKALGNADKEC
jgi:hypothetical protein